MAYYDLHVRLNGEDPQDRVIIEYLNRLGGRGKAPWVRQVLYKTIIGPSNREILEIVQDIQEKVESLQTNSGRALTLSSRPMGEEPEEAARNLDSLISRLSQWGAK